MIRYLNKRRKVIIFAIAVMAITMIPYVVGYAQQGEEWRYTGFVIGLEDGNSYIAKMLSGSSGRWLFRSPHSAVDQNGVIAYLPYLLLGKLVSGAAQHDQLVVLYHLARFIFGSLAILATYDFIAIYLKRENLRWWALGLITFGGGLGWIMVAISQKGFMGSLPLEFISPESFGFLGLMGFPHLAAARAFFLWGLTAFVKKGKGFVSGALWLITGFFQPMVVVLGWAVIGSYTALVFIIRTFFPEGRIGAEGLYGKTMIIKALQSIAVSCPIVIYTAFIFLADPYFKIWTIQNQFASPHIFHYILAYGLVLPFTILGIRYLLRSGKQESLMLTGWLVMSPFLVYAPVIAQRRLAEGLWVVLIVGMIGNYSKIGRIPLAIKGIMMFLLPSTLFIYLGSIQATIVPAEPLFRKIEEVQVYEFIAESATQESIILSSFEVGNNLPAWAPIKVVMGHGPETIGLGRIKSDVNDFFKSNSANMADCSAFFGKFDVDYLFWGPKEQVTWQADIGKLECLGEVYNNGDYSLYEVVSNEK